MEQNNKQNNEFYCRSKAVQQLNASGQFSITFTESNLRKIGEGGCGFVYITEFRGGSSDNIVVKYQKQGSSEGEILYYEFCEKMGPKLSPHLIRTLYAAGEIVVM
ncbi:MAG: hypothetical protein LBB24_02660, partial [Rickettsiales bacterium]|nr:hypothetical protein [Rickettsiales bacterium]